MVLHIITMPRITQKAIGVLLISIVVLNICFIYTYNAGGKPSRGEDLLLPPPPPPPRGRPYHTTVLSPANC